MLLVLLTPVVWPVAKAGYGYDAIVDIKFTVKYLKI
jgi:hypothetical protein